MKSSNFCLDQTSGSNSILSFSLNPKPAEQFNHAPVKWAQRSESLLVTICLRDCEDCDLKVTTNRLKFQGRSFNQMYSFDMELYKEVDPKFSTWSQFPQNIQLKIFKKVKDESFWPRLLLDKNKERNNVTIDWDKYVDEEDEEVDFADEIKNIDAVIASLDDDAVANEELIANIETSMFSEVFSEHLTESFDEIDVEGNLILTTDNFDPDDPNLRPELWRALLNKRLLLKEYVDLMESNYDSLFDVGREEKEDRLMVEEVNYFGRLLNVEALRVKGSIERASVYVTADNFDPLDPGRRPLGWAAVRLRRVIARESLDERTDYAQRSLQVFQEEKVMLTEIAQYGQLVKLGSASEHPEQVAQLQASAVTEEDVGRGRARTNTLRGRANSALGRDRANTLDRARASTATGMGGLGRGRASTLRAVLEERDEEELNDDQRARRDQMMRRVLVREQNERANGVDEDTIQANRSVKVAEESARIDEETAKNGGVLPGASESVGRRRAATLQGVSNIHFDGDNFNPGQPSVRPTGWAEIRSKRVFLKEHIERLNGVSEKLILERRPQKEIDEEIEMVGEVVVFGRLLNVGENGRDVTPLYPPLVIGDSELDAAFEDVLPSGWERVRNQRVVMRELEYRLLGRPEKEVEDERTALEGREVEAMRREARDGGKVHPLGTRRGQLTQSNVSAVDATQQQSFETISEEKDSEPAPLPVVVNASDVDPSQPNRKPKGWGEIKLRKVYAKEWQDRRDGEDEAAIMDRRFQREREVEEEMTQALSVHGRIQLIESRMQSSKTKAAPVYPKHYAKTR